MSAKASPRPWHTANFISGIEDANNGKVAANIRASDAALIVDAVNERDRLRDLIKRLITIREHIFWRKDERTGFMYYDTTIDEDEARRTIEEARAAIGEDKT